MADQNITALPVATSPVSSDQLLLVGATEEKLIDYDKLADAILTKLTSKQYTLDQGTKTLPAALNELNSKTWDSIGTYDIPASDAGITVQIPSNAKEILLFVGAKNNQQVYGGKSYIMRVTNLNIVYEKEVFSATGNSVGTGFYAYCNNNALIMKCQTSNTVIAQVHIK